MPGYAGGDSTDAAATLANDKSARDLVQDSMLSELRQIRVLLARLLSESVVTSDGQLPEDDPTDFRNQGVN